MNKSVVIVEDDRALRQQNPDIGTASDIHCIGALGLRRRLEGDSGQDAGRRADGYQITRNVRDRLRRKAEANVAIAADHHGDNIRGK